jgi:hypothetical protein
MINIFTEEDQAYIKVHANPTDEEMSEYVLITLEALYSVIETDIRLDPFADNNDYIQRHLLLILKGLIVNMPRIAKLLNKEGNEICQTTLLSQNKIL